MPVASLFFLSAVERPSVLFPNVDCALRNASATLLLTGLVFFFAVRFHCFPFHWLYRSRAVLLFLCREADVRGLGLGFPSLNCWTK